MNYLNEIEKWDNNKWNQQVVYCKPSSGGAVGVIFVWAGRAYSRQSFLNPSTAAFVIKPAQGSAAPTKFAEHMLGKIGGLISPNSRPIQRHSYSGSGLMLTLKMFRDKETDPIIKQRWLQIFSKYDLADGFLIQDVQSNIKEFGEEYRETGGLAKLLTDQTLMTNLGKLFAADALIGNGDRLSNANMGNVIFKPDGTLCSIDSTTILTDFQAILNDSSKLSNSSATNYIDVTAQNWATNDIVKNGWSQIPTPAQQKKYDPLVSGTEPVLAPSFPLQSLDDVNTWWTNKFRPHLESGLTSMKPPLPSPADSVWDQAKTWFAAGVKEGIRQIDLQLSGFNWLLVKNKYKNYINRYGGDPNLDWTNFKIRRMYIKMLSKGYKEDAALEQVSKYVDKKFPATNAPQKTSFTTSIAQKMRFK